ncbi:MAG: hypothetical protein ACE5H4_12770 [Candidatus Thorarchaeota archaeon]
MSFRGSDWGPMTVWCPIIPAENLLELSRHRKGLRKISDAYYDWCASMRPKTLDGATIGVLLDRIRMLMMSMGIAVGQDRELAEKVQKIVSQKLRTGALRLVSDISAESAEKRAIKKTLALFFARVKFTRDIDPLEEIRASMPELAALKSEMAQEEQGTSTVTIEARGPSEHSLVDLKLGLTKAVMVESTNVIVRLYTRLLSPDPWGNNE